MGKYSGLFFGSTPVACIGRVFCGLILGLIVCTQDAAALTYYISPTGNNGANGTSTAMPWQTYARALVTGSPKAGCGDTLIVMDGTYTAATHGSLNIANFDCTINNPLIVQAQNQRAALLQDDGSGEVIRITASSYVTINGLRVKSVDNSEGAGASFALILVAGSGGGLTSPSDHITLKNLIVSHNNRYVNMSLIRVAATTQALLEDIELYSYHRHGAVFSANVSNSVMRRIYCNSRSYPDISGGFPSGNTTKGDSCVANYTSGGATVNSNSNVFENIISEGNSAGFDIEAVMGPSNNKFYGNISLNDTYGFLFKARGDTLITQQPLDTIVKDAVVITPSAVGIYLRGNRNTQITNATLYNSDTNSGFIADVECPLGVCRRGSGTVSVFGTNILSTLNTKGFNITEQTAWSFNEVNSFGNSTNYSPALPANFTNATITDPALGTCRVWIPDDSPMKRAGKNGGDIGANILYRYKNGVLTNMPLWNPTTGEFPHGAIVSGVNDVPGRSAFDVHKRLNVNTNGCPFPANYGDGVTDVDAPSSPVGLRLF